MRRFSRVSAALLALALPSALLAQQRGQITGTVIAAENGNPLPSVNIVVEGTTLRTTTGPRGNFSIQVPAGSYAVVASQLGRTGQTLRTTVAAGGTSTLNFRLATSAVNIDALVVTATGTEQRRRELGSSVGVVNVGEVEMAPIQNVGQLLEGRVAGAVVLPSSGTVGAGSRIRIRGNNSLSLSNAPLLVIDGIRVQNDEQSLGFGVGGQQPSRLDDLNPEDIESIEVLKGPSASALYGTAAANGVIQVTTKRGRAGRPQFRMWSELGRDTRAFTAPTNVAAVDAGGDICPIYYEAAGFCTPVSTFTFNPLENSATTPFRRGDRRNVGGSVSGGSTDATYYVSGEYEDAKGVQVDNNYRKINTQANLTGNIGQTFRVTSRVGWVESDLRLPLGDNALFGVFGMGLDGLPTPDNVDANKGFESDPQFAYDWITSQAISRFTGSVNASWQPRSWLTINGIAGLDRSNRDELNRIPRNSIYSSFGGDFTFGNIDRYNVTDYNVTTTGSATAEFHLNPDLVSTTSLGTQYLRETTQAIEAYGANLTPGIERSLAGASESFFAGESNVLNATVAAYGQQQFGWRDRLFLNAAVRGDRNSAFGANLGWIWYPSFSGSWVISDEPFFPDMSALNTLRLRAAYGQSGLRPNANDALLSFTSQSAVFGTIVGPGFVFNELGNPDLKPERSREIELGFESELLDNRLGLEVTHFDKKSTDALVRKPLPHSAGSSTSRFVNIGEVSNTGWETSLRAHPIRTQNMGLDLTLSGSFVHNRLVDLGTDAQGNPIPPIVLSSRQRHVEGFPLGGWWMIPIESFGDANGDGLIQPNEVTVGVRRADGTLKGDSVAYFGSPFPTRELSLSANFSLRRWLKVSALFDHKGGQKLVNMTRAWRCVNAGNCAEAYDRSTPLDLQAAMVARALLPGGTWSGFIEDADFTKFRELSFTLGAPQGWIERFGASGLSLTIAGRNLHTWTSYTGFDPEVNFGGTANFTAGDFATLPANRQWSARIDLTF